jgi:hypothetical protein
MVGLYVALVRRVSRVQGRHVTNDDVIRKSKNEALPGNRSAANVFGNKPPIHDHYHG